MSRRLMIYTAPVAAGGIDAFTTHISRALEQILANSAWQTAILRKPSNGLNQGSVNEPVTPENTTEDSARLSADNREFSQLVGQQSVPFDVLYLPSPWGTVPLGTTMTIPAPVVMTIHDFEFEDTDYGLVTDQYRREAQKFAKLGSAFVFSSEYVRQRAIDLFQFPRERTHVIYQAPTPFASGTSADVRQKYGLPERFAFTMGWLSRRKNGAVLVEALGLLKQKGLPSLPLVTAGHNFDDILSENIAHQHYQEQTQKRIKELGLNDIHDLGVIDQVDIPALIQAATIVIAPSKSEAGLSYLMLDAMALGTPLIHSRIAAVTERLGSDDTYALGFDPYNPEELVSKITDVLRDESAAKARAEKAKTLIGRRTQEDVARDYFGIFKSVSECPWKTRQRQRNHVMRSREERVAWLIDNPEAGDTELPMIRQFGLEVYSSKTLPAGTDYPAAVDYSEDEHSTLPNWVLDRLNQHNFYENGLNSSIVELLNGYFGTLITSPFNPVLRDLLQHYSGRILLRVFGDESPHNYREFFASANNGELWKSIWEVQHRVWFITRFEESVPPEAKLVRNRECILPMVLPDHVLRSSGQWVGTDKRILFVCPEIASEAGRSGACYSEFKKHVGHLPHLIGGRQSLPVDDPAVTGLVSDDVMRSWFRELRVMFYADHERYHLEYPPLEAAAHGMPLIYLKGSLVDALMGEGKPGACHTYEEAEQKLLRILNGDDAFTKSVIESQSTLLDRFRPEYVKAVWKDRFFNSIMSTSVIPDVIPFAKWQEPSPATEVSPRPLLPDRHIGTYVLAVTGGGVYKYVTGVVHTAVQMAESKRWRFSLIWGSPTIGQGSYTSPTWEYPKHRLLSILPAHSIIFTSHFWTDLKRARPITRWRRSPIYLRYRVLRFGTEAALIPLQYVQGMINQRTLLPDTPQLREEMMTSRMGRRILNTGIVQRIAKLKKSGGIEGQNRVDYLKNPPENSQPIVLPEISSPPLQPYLTLQQINTLKKRYDALLFGNPFRIISPNTLLAPLTRQPVVITMYDLAHEYTEVWDKSAPSVSREMVIWGKLAQKIVFGSEHIRTEAIKRYGIPEANTQIVRPPPLVIRTSRPDANEIQQVRTKLNLPERYLFNTGFQGSHKNNITIFQAIRILRWRGFDVPPFVIGGGEARRFLTGQVGTEYVVALQNVIKESQLEIGREIIILDYIEEDDLPAVYAGASVGISMSRSESTVHGMITETMLYGAPIIASTIPQNVEELGINDQFALLVPPDDPVALADAIEYTLNNPVETAARIKRADTYIHAKTWEKMAGEFLGIFEEIAASRSATN